MGSYLWLYLTVLCIIHQKLSFGAQSDTKIEMRDPETNEEYDVDVSELVFFLYCRHPDHCDYMQDENSFKNYNINPNKPTVIITHGWQGTCNQINFLCDEIKRRYFFFFETKYNIFLVNWARFTQTSVYNTMQQSELIVVGRFIGSFLDALIEERIKAKDMHLIGVNVGAHLLSIAAQERYNKNDKIGRITGLDPTWPPAIMRTPSTGLDQSDAIIVDVYHACGALPANNYQTGHINIWPSAERCEGRQGAMYFLAGFNAFNRCVAQKCQSYELYMSGACQDGAIIQFGELLTPDSRRSFTNETIQRFIGDYYLHTTKENGICRDIRALQEQIKNKRNQLRRRMH